MNTEGRLRTERGYLSFVAALTVAAAMLLAVPMASAASANAPPPPPSIPPGSVSATWAYGKNLNWSGNELRSFIANNSTVTQNLSEKGSLAIGLEVIYIQTNTSGGAMVQTYEALTVVASVAATYQASSSSGYTASATLNFQANGWYVVQDFLNFSNSAQVILANGAAVPALGLENAATEVSANLAASFSASATDAYGVTSTSYSANGTIGAAVSGNAGVQFQPSLGLIPLNVTPGQSWSSQANYTDSGALQAAFHEYYQYPVALAGTLNGSGPHCPPGSQQIGQDCVFSNASSGSLGVTGSGTAFLSGTDLGTIVLPTPTSGVTITADKVAIDVSGGWGFSDGLVLVPSTLAGATSGGSVGPLSTLHSLARTASAASGNGIYYQPNDPSHIGVLGSDGGTIGGKQFSATPQDPHVAAQQAESNLNGATGGSTGSGGLPVMLILLVVVVAVVVITSAVIWTGRKRRRMPPSATSGQPGQMPGTYLQSQAPAPPGYSQQSPTPVPPSPPNGNGSRDPVGHYW